IKGPKLRLTGASGPEPRCEVLFSRRGRDGHELLDQTHPIGEVHNPLVVCGDSDREGQQRGSRRLAVAHKSGPTTSDQSHLTTGIDHSDAIVQSIRYVYVQRVINRAALRPVQSRLPTVSRERVRSAVRDDRSEEHTSELQSPCNLVCRLLLEKKKKKKYQYQLKNKKKKKNSNK